jgi:hypothetical protein
VQIGKQQIKLHSDEPEAFRVYQRLMADRGKDEREKAHFTSVTIAEIFGVESAGEAQGAGDFIDRIADFSVLRDLPAKAPPVWGSVGTCYY